MQEFSFKVFEAFAAATVLYLLTNLVVVLLIGGGAGAARCTAVTDPTPGVARCLELLRLSSRRRTPRPTARGPLPAPRNVRTRQRASFATPCRRNGARLLANRDAVRRRPASPDFRGPRCR